MKDDRVATVVVNWNLPEETSRCLRSLQESEHPCDIFFVDNGSSDGSVNTIQEQFQGIRTILLPQNNGFSSACNHAIKMSLETSEYDFIFLLNNDANVHPKAITHLVDRAQKEPGAGILAPKIYFRNPPARIWYAGARRRRGVLAAAGTGRGETDRGQFDRTSTVDYIFGAAMFIRRDVFDKIGLLDERYFLYLEDLDFCLRAQQARYSLKFVPAAQVWHTGSASTARDPSLRRYHHIRSTILFLQKHRDLVAVIPAFFFWTGVFLRMAAKDLVQGNFHMLRSYWKAAVSGLKRPKINSIAD